MLRRTIWEIHAISELLHINTWCKLCFLDRNRRTPDRILPIKSFKRILGIVPGGTLEGIAEAVFGRIIIFGTFSGEAVARIPKET